MRDIDYGTVRIKLNELIEQQGISKNRLAHNELLKYANEKMKG